MATTKSGTVVDADEDVAWMETRAQGVVVPIPILPWELMRKAVVVASWVV